MNKCLWPDGITTAFPHTPKWFEIAEESEERVDSMKASQHATVLFGNFRCQLLMTFCSTITSKYSRDIYISHTGTSCSDGDNSRRAHLRRAGPCELDSLPQNRPRTPGVHPRLYIVKSKKA